MHNDGAAEDALRTDQLDELVSHRGLGVALGVGLEVAEVTNVALSVLGGTVGLVVRVDWENTISNANMHTERIPRRKRMPPGRGPQGSGLTVRAGRGAAVGVVAVGMDVHATLGVGIVAGDVPADGGVGTL